MYSQNFCHFVFCCYCVILRFWLFECEHRKNIFLVSFAGLTNRYSCNKIPAYHIERSVFELNRTQSNVNRTIKFDVVRSSNEIELQKINANRTKSNVR